MPKRLFIVALCIALLAGCAAVAEEPPVGADGNPPEPTTTQAPETASPDWPWCDECDVYCSLAYWLANRPSTAPIHMTDSATDALMQTFSVVHELTYRVNWPLTILLRSCFGRTSRCAMFRISLLGGPKLAEALMQGKCC